MDLSRFRTLLELQATLEREEQAGLARVPGGNAVNLVLDRKLLDLLDKVGLEAERIRKIHAQTGGKPARPGPGRPQPAKPKSSKRKSSKQRH